MSNEIVKHHNDLNNVVMRKWTSEEMNFFFAIIAKARNQGTNDLIFDKYQLAELANYSIQHNKRFAETMDRLANHITELRYIERTNNSVSYMPLFTYFKVDWTNDLSDMTATVSVSPKFEYILNKISANFTQYELAEFTKIRSTYAKTAYRLLKQWRTVGHKEFKIDEFKLLMDTPMSYKSSHIDRLVIKPILKELKPYFSKLKIKKIKSNKRGNPVLAYEFTWKPEKSGQWIENKYDKESMQSNVPTWSQPNYKASTSQKDLEELEKRKKQALDRLRKSKEE